MNSMHDLDLLHLQFLTQQTVNSFFSQRASFSLRVSVMKAKNLMAKDANGETFQALNHLFSSGKQNSVKYANSNIELKSFSWHSSANIICCRFQHFMAIGLFKISEACAVMMQCMMVRILSILLMTFCAAMMKLKNTSISQYQLSGAVAALL